MDGDFGRTHGRETEMSPQWFRPDAVSAAQKEAHEKVMARREQARAAATATIEKVDRNIKAAGDNVKSVGDSLLVANFLVRLTPSNPLGRHLGRPTFIIGLGSIAVAAAYPREL